jgi:hypothetical protein
MKTNKLLLAAILAAAIAAPIAGFVSDMRGQPMTSTTVPIRRPRKRMAEFAGADAGSAARQGRPGQLLDLHLHQLAPPAAICPCLA